MGIFRRRHNGGAALAERQPAEPAREPLAEATEPELIAEIEALMARNRSARNTETEKRLLTLRHLLGIRRTAAGGSAACHPEPDQAALPEWSTELPSFSRAEVTPGLMRAAMLRDGCLLVRGLIDREAALHFADQIDRAFTLRDRYEAEQVPTDGYYDEFAARPGHGEAMAREWIKMGGGVLATDSPRLAFELIELWDAAGLPALVEGYLGEPGNISAQKTTLRKAEPSVPGAWHQDGAFMGEVRALNLWLSLSRCGDLAPGLDIVPKRLELVRTQTEEAVLDYQVSQAAAEEAAGERQILRPIFEPGDALFFDDVFLHKTGSDPSMPNPRFAIESWFFGGSAFPLEYAPVAI